MIVLLLIDYGSFVYAGVVLRVLCRKLLLYIIDLPDIRVTCIGILVVKFPNACLSYLQLLSESFTSYFQ